ncbi:AraC family transcriptional regulator [bacterium DOLZORAL124_64_63]|nr:MAG: AraC family transcriptional regulator [bacterium DOLZORAL124_64_63]
MKKTTRQDYEERMLRVLLHIRDNLDRNPGLDELAAVAHFSPYHFHRIFRGMVGESLQSHLRRLRIEQAAFRLATTDDAVIQVALGAGFESHAAFSRAFRAVMGCSPSDWRARGTDQVVGTNPAALLRCPTEEEKMDVKIVQEDEQRVAFVRHTGPYDQCDQAWDRLCTHLGAAGRLGPDCRFIGLCYDDPDITPADKLRYDACVSVDADFQPEGDIGVQVLPGGCFAQTTHFGPYENLSITYSRLLGQWLPASGRRFKQEVIREVYLNDPQTAEPEDLVTDILLPLEEA